jgi:protein-disulfide isomerase
MENEKKVDEKISEVESDNETNVKVINENTKSENKAFDKNEGNWIDRLRENPWMVSTVVLIVVLLGFAFFGLGSGGVTGNVIGEDEAAANLVSFIESQSPTGEKVEVISSERMGELYKVTLNFQGQEIPVYVSLDGQFLIADVIPLDPSLLPSIPGSGPGNVEPLAVEVRDAPVKGSEDALVEIVEFSDYQCPFCAKFYSETLGLIQENYIDTGKVKLVYMDFPLDIHPEAQGAAEAAHCVRKQKGDEGYYMMHDILFENQVVLSGDNYKNWAREIGVDGTVFDECLDSGEFADVVSGNMLYGQSLGVTGTPAFFVNGKLVSGAQPYSVFEELIESELSGN